MNKMHLDSFEEVTEQKFGDNLGKFIRYQRTLEYKIM